MSKKKRKYVMGETHKKNISKANKGRKPHINTLNSTRKPVYQKDLRGNIIKEWFSALQAAKTLNLQQAHITHCCKKRRRTHGGYIWEYVEDYEIPPLAPTKTGKVR